MKNKPIDYKDFFQKLKKYRKLKGERCFNCFELLEKIDEHTYRFNCKCVKECPELKNVIVSVG